MTDSPLLHENSNLADRYASSVIRSVIANIDVQKSSNPTRMRELRKDLIDLVNKHFDYTLNHKE